MPGSDVPVWHLFLFGTRRYAADIATTNEKLADRRSKPTNSAVVALN